MPGCAGGSIGSAATTSTMVMTASASSTRRATAGRTPAKRVVTDNAMGPFGSGDAYNLASIVLTECFRRERKAGRRISAVHQGQAHEALPLRPLRQRPLFREHRLRELRPRSRLLARDQHAGLARARDRPLPRPAPSRPEIRLLRQCARRRLQLARGLRAGRRSLLSRLPPQRHRAADGQSGERR